MTGKHPSQTSTPRSQPKTPQVATRTPRPQTKTPQQLPRWKCRDQRDADKLTAWTLAKLDEEHAISEMLIHLGDGLPPRLLPTFEYAMEVYYETGDKSLIQQVDPKIAKRLLQRKPSGKRGGGRTPNEKHGDRIWQAVWDVKLIKQIWQEHFGHYYRPKNDKVRARDMAAKHHSIKEGSRAEVTFDQRLRKLKAVSSYPKSGA
jgi:hypothetical protein